MSAPTAITVGKIGGGLDADPDRRRALLRAIADGAHGACVVVPGGGRFADAVRAAQAREGFDDGEAHRRALDAMGRMAAIFHEVEARLEMTTAPWAAYPPAPSEGEGTPRRGGGEGSDGSAWPAPVATSCTAAAVSRPGLKAGPPSPADGGGMLGSWIWDPIALRAGHPDISETWDVTSDSLALWLAARLNAARCTLVKAADAPPGADAAALRRLGLVDGAFPAFAARYRGAIAIWGPSGPVAVRARAAA